MHDAYSFIEHSFSSQAFGVKHSRRALALSLSGLIFIGTAIIALQGQNFALLNPQGSVARQERELLFFALGLSLVVVVPVFILTGAIVWRYRVGRNATYTPEWDHNRAAETLWWGVPVLLITLLSVVTWRSTHELEPSRPLQLGSTPLKVQVVALPWKWLFIYPEQQLATVNYLELPVNRPIVFEITADAPMNSFWIPQLGGQIYAMPGMSSYLNLTAQTVGEYRGSSANMSGAGFSGMNFPVRAVTSSEFAHWVTRSQAPGTELNATTYRTLALPSTNAPEQTYSSLAGRLYDKVVMQYMAPLANLGTTDVDAPGRVTPLDYKASAEASIHHD